METAVSGNTIYKVDKQKDCVVVYPFVSYRLSEKILSITVSDIHPTEELYRTTDDYYFCVGNRYRLKYCGEHYLQYLADKIVEVIEQHQE